MKTLVIDNHDSFTFNLVQLIAEVNGTPPIVVTNGEAAWADLALLEFDNIVLSPGPGRPERARDFGVCRQAIELSNVPLFGVCLGHQGLAHVWGGEVVYAPEPMHGRLSPVHHDGQGLFAGIPQGFAAVRYHSLVAREPLPACLERNAWTPDHILMALRHRERPQWGVQFHPESIATEQGAALLRNFRDLSRLNLRRLNQ
jgi:para-aminobenzoate synthetase